MPELTPEQIAEGIINGKVVVLATVAGIPSDPGTRGPAYPEDGSIHNRHLSPDASAVNTQNLVDFSVTADKLADKSVTSSKLADNAVQTRSYADASITLQKLAGAAVDNTKVKPPLVIPTPQTKPADLSAAPTAADFNGLLALLKTAGVLK